MAKENLERALRNVVETIDVANTLTEPLTRSIENLLKMAAASLKSEEASVLARDGSEGDLVFLVAIGKVADQLQGMKIPSGKGIAGFVFSSGQPVAIADAEREESFYDEVDKKTGYSTQTILATPLRYNGEVIGVLEFINRLGDPPYEPFTPFEMDKAALFAEAIASLLDAFESARMTESICGRWIKDSSEKETISAWLENLRSTSEHKETLEIALLIRQFSSRGPSERKLCKDILESVLRYAENGAERSFLSY